MQPTAPTQPSSVIQQATPRVMANLAVAGMGSAHICTALRSIESSES